MVLSARHLVHVHFSFTAGPDCPERSRHSVRAIIHTPGGPGMDVWLESIKVLEARSISRQFARLDEDASFSFCRWWLSWFWLRVRR